MQVSKQATTHKETQRQTPMTPLMNTTSKNTPRKNEEKKHGKEKKEDFFEKKNNNKKQTEERNNDRKHMPISIPSCAEISIPECGVLCSFPEFGSYCSELVAPTASCAAHQLPQIQLSLCAAHTSWQALPRIMLQPKCLQDRTGGGILHQSRAHRLHLPNHVHPSLTPEHHHGFQLARSARDASF